jgi:hypothetical protein
VSQDTFDIYRRHPCLILSLSLDPTIYKTPIAHRFGRSVAFAKLGLGRIMLKVSVIYRRNAE